MASTGDSIEADIAGWTFGGEVAKTFDRHVRRSVPLYAEGHDLTLKVADFFVTDDSVCYDLGCSTGELTYGLADRFRKKSARFVGIDSEEGMIEQAREKCAGLDNVELQCSNILDVELEKSDLIVCYFLVQFIRPRNRQVLIDRIYESLNWGGALVLFEKVRGPDARFQDLITTIYNDFKIDQGFTGEEIVNKTRSLKGVLEPFSTQGNLDMLKRAGFVDITTIMKYLAFEGFLAIK